MGATRPEANTFVRMLSNNGNQSIGTRIRVNYKFKPSGGAYLIKEVLVKKSGPVEVYKKGMGPYLIGRKE